MGIRCRLVDLQGSRFRNIGAELRAELGHVVSKECGLVAGAGDGDVAKAGVEQGRVDGGVGVHYHPLGGESLRTVAGNGVSVVKVAMVQSVEFKLAVVVETG